MHQLLTLSIAQAFLNSSFVYPNPWMAAKGEVAGAGVVCTVSFGISPLNDRIYVDTLRVDERHQRKGLASALLLAIVDSHRVAGRRLPITALCETYGAAAFWNALRDGRVPGLAVTRDLRPGEMSEEQRRWRIALMTDG